MKSYVTRNEFQSAAMSEIVASCAKMIDNGTKVLAICKMLVKGYWLSPVAEFCGVSMSIKMS